MIGGKEPNDDATQRPSHTRRCPRPAAGWRRPEDGFRRNVLLDDLKKALAERVLNAEMDHHLACDRAGNRRNGYGKKTVITDTGQTVS